MYPAVGPDPHSPGIVLLHGGPFGHPIRTQSAARFVAEHAEFADALSERARAGVQVHVLLDWIGSDQLERRQRPDVDAVYMNATQALTGWRAAWSRAMVAPSEWPTSTGRSSFLNSRSNFCSTSSALPI